MVYTKRFFLPLVLLLIASACPLSAQECCIRPCEDPVDWTGFYISGQLGMGTNREHSVFTNANYFNTQGAALLGNDFSNRSQGFLEGGALGCNLQFDRFVIGIEGGGISTNLRKKRKSPFFPDIDRYTSHLECLLTAKGRVGYACDSILTFVTGGWATGHDHLKFIDTSSTQIAKLKTWVHGWTAGCGFDCRCADWFSLGLEYDYTLLQYREKTVSCPACGEGAGFGTPTVKDSLHIQTLTMRINYHL